MREMYSRSRQRNLEDDIAWRRRCVCWYEPVNLNSERRNDGCRCDDERIGSRNRRNRCHCNIEGISLQLTTVDDKELSTGCPVIFDEVLTDHSWYMNYDEHNGVVEVRKHGLYVIDWDIAVEGVRKECFASFAIEVNGEVKASTILPETVGQLSGRALVHVNKIPTSIRLINNGNPVELSNFTPVANFRIFSVE